MQFFEAEMRPEEPGIIECKATNTANQFASETKRVILNELSEPFKISGWNDNKKALTGDDIEIRCEGNSLVYHSNATWLKDGQNLTETIITNSTAYSWSSTLKLTNISESDQGKYECHAMSKLNETSASETRQINIFVTKSFAPDVSVQLISPKQLGGKVLVGEFTDNVQIQCTFFGLPIPAIKWYKDGNIFDVSDSRVKINDTLIEFVVLKTSDLGIYSCNASNREGSDEKIIELQVDRE